MLSDLVVKNAKFGRRSELIRRNGVCCAVDDPNYICHICAKGLLDSNFNEVVINKILIFHEITPNSTYSQES